MKKSFPKLILYLLLSVLYLQANAKKTPESTTNDIKISSSTISGLQFRSIGPAFCSGRIADIAVNPENRAEYYVAVASGGVWKTTNNGISWNPVFDNEGSYSIGIVTIDPNNQNVVWVGTGEYNSQRSVSYGDGVYKSEDGGKSWKNMGLKNSEHIGKIIIDPRNSDIVYVAAQGPLWGPGGDRGLYKTTNGGESWAKVLEISENTGVTDIVYDPRNPDVLYAASWQRRRRQHTMIAGGPESRIYKSTNAGKTWKKLESGLPGTDIGRIGLAISPVNPDYVFAIFEAKNNAGGFFRTTDRGASWQKMSSYHSDGDYWNRIYCDPKDIDRIYSMDFWINITNDGGKNFESMPLSKTHVDYHCMYIDPNDTDYMLIGCDGGIYETYEAGNKWLFKDNLPIAQFYRVAVDNSKPFYYVYGGTQDNQSMGGPSQTIYDRGIANSDWFITQGGDGFFSQIDPENPNIVYAESQYGGLVRYDRQSGQSTYIKPIHMADEEPYRWNWNAPIIISPHANKTLYFAANKLFKSTDRGDSWTTISNDLTRQINRNKLPVMGKVWGIDAVLKNVSTTIYGTIVSLNESPIKQGLIYAGTDDGLIQVTENDGETWTKTSQFINVPEKTYVSSIYPSNFNENVVFASFDNHKHSDFKPYVLKSNDKGKTWSSITGDLPVRGSVHAIVQDFKNPDLLFVGTEFGAYFSNNAGKNWHKLNGLPTIAVRDIAIQKEENDLVVATFGRGFYILDDYSPLRYLNNEHLNKSAHLFQIPDVLMYKETEHLTTAYLGDAYYSAENPEFGACITYYVKDKETTLKQQRQQKESTLEKANKPVPYPRWQELEDEKNEVTPFFLFTILDEDNNEIRRLKQGYSTGVNRIYWDLCYAGTSPVKNQKNFSATAQSEDGVPVMPGKYKVTMSKYVRGNFTPFPDTIEFITKPLNNVTLPAKNAYELVAFQKEVAEFTRVFDGYKQIIDDLDQNLNALKKAVLDTPGSDISLLKTITSMENEVNEIKKKIYGNSIISKYQENQPASLNTRLYDIAYTHWNSTSAVTEKEKMNLHILESEFEKIQKQISVIINQQLPDVNKKLDAVDAPYTEGRFI